MDTALRIRPAYRLGRFVGFSLHNGREPIGKAFAQFKLAVIALVSLAATGCSISPAQQKWVGIGAGILIVGAMAAHDADSGKATVDLGRVPTPHVDCSTGGCR